MKESLFLEGQGFKGFSKVFWVHLYFLLAFFFKCFFFSLIRRCTLQLGTVKWGDFVGRSVLKKKNVN